MLFASHQDTRQNTCNQEYLYVCFESNKKFVEPQQFRKYPVIQHLITIPERTKVRRQNRHSLSASRDLPRTILWNFLWCILASHWMSFFQWKNLYWCMCLWMQRCFLNIIHSKKSTVKERYIDIKAVWLSCLSRTLCNDTEWKIIIIQTIQIHYQQHIINNNTDRSPKMMFPWPTGKRKPPPVVISRPSTRKSWPSKDGVPTTEQPEQNKKRASCNDSIENELLNPTCV